MTVKSAARYRRRLGKPTTTTATRGSAYQTALTAGCQQLPLGRPAGRGEDAAQQRDIPDHVDKAVVVQVETSLVAGNTAVPYTVVCRVAAPRAESAADDADVPDHINEAVVVQVPQRLRETHLRDRGARWMRRD